MKQLRIGLGVSQYEVARRGGIQLAVYMRVERGETNPTLATLSAVCRGLGVSFPELVGSLVASGPGTREVVIVFPRTQAERDKLAISERPENFVPIPLLADAAGLGSGRIIEDAKLEGYCLIYKDWLGKGRHYAIRVHGDSMIPTLGDGDIVAVDFNEITPRTLRGKVVAIKIAEGVAIKRFQIREGMDKPWYFQADNSDWEHERGQITAKPKDGLILGKVVWAWRRMG